MDTPNDLPFLPATPAGAADVRAPELRSIDGLGGSAPTADLACAINDLLIVRNASGVSAAEIAAVVTREICFRRFEHVLRKHGLVDPAAFDDPEGFDSYRTHGAAHAAYRELLSPNVKGQP